MLLCWLMSVCDQQIILQLGTLNVRDQLGNHTGWQLLNFSSCQTFNMVSTSYIDWLSLAGVLVIAVWLYAQWHAWRRSSRPQLVFARTQFNVSVL
jgi:hypothetical protein